TASAAIEAALPHHREVRAAYLAQHSGGALALMDHPRELALFGLPPLSAGCREPIARFRTDPPGAAWDGGHPARANGTRLLTSIRRQLGRTACIVRATCLCTRTTVVARRVYGRWSGAPPVGRGR